MTVTNTKYKDLVVSGSSVVEFPFTFKVTNTEWVKCYLAVTAGAAPVEVTNFAVTLYPDQETQEGGIVTFVDAPAAGTVAIVRVVPATQELDYTAYGAFPADSHERALDKVTFQQQLTAGEKQRFVKYGYVTDFEGTTDVTLEKYIVAGWYLRWGGEGEIESYDLKGYVDQNDTEIRGRVANLENTLIVDGESSYLTLSYNNGSAIGGETEIPSGIVFKSINALHINGVKQTYGTAWVYDVGTQIITIAEPLEPKDDLSYEAGLDPLKVVSSPSGINELINSNFQVWERGDSFTHVGAGGFTADMWRGSSSHDGSTEVSRDLTDGSMSIITTGATLLNEFNHISEQKINNFNGLKGEELSAAILMISDKDCEVFLRTFLVSEGASVPASVKVVSAMLVGGVETSLEFPSWVMGDSPRSVSDESYVVVQIYNNNLNETTKIFNIQLKKGKGTPDFSTQGGSEGAERGLCSFYHQRYVDGFSVGSGTAYVPTTVYAPFKFPRMRKAPSYVPSADGIFRCFGDGASSVDTTTATQAVSTTSMDLAITINITQGTAVFVRIDSPSSWFSLSAEFSQYT